MAIIERKIAAVSANQADIAFLGPYRRTASNSINRYYEWCTKRLPPTGLTVAGLAPPVSFPARQHSQLLFAWDHFWRWRRILARNRAPISHIVDQGLAWYGVWVQSPVTIVTVHHLFHLNQPCAGHATRWLREASVRVLRRANHLVAISQHTADMIMHTLDVSAQRITVIYNSIDPHFHPLACTQREAAKRKWFAGADHAILHVSYGGSYKNRKTVIRAFAVVRESLRGAHLYFTASGADDSERKLIRELNLTQAVHFLGLLSDASLRDVYAAADVLVFPSVEEGFGLPVVEAMACGCPVICSRAGALSEIVENAALKIPNPFDFCALARAAVDVIKTPALADELASRGLIRAAYFTSDRSSTAMAELHCRLYAKYT
jgi:glycosyltransferase involved in cell wall biosynthesis